MIRMGCGFMSEPPNRVDPIPDELFAGRGVTIVLAPPMSRFSLRARRAADVAALLGNSVPDRIGWVTGGVACLGPDEWLYRAVEGSRIRAAEGSSVAVADISERAICLIVEGPRAAQLLMSGCPLDLDGFAVGQATRTIYETVEIILLRVADDCFHVEVWRSFAPWLWAALTTAANH
jgi:sarcosine oxidase, subunit gamma